jgi:hypothetical protein
VKLLRDKNFKEHWGTIKATVGLIKNLALSSTIIPQLSEQNAVRILTELLKNVDQERTKVSMETKQYLSQFDHMIEIIIGALNNLAKDSLCKSMIKEMDSISVVIRVREKNEKVFYLSFLDLFLVFVFTVVFITTNSE